MHHRSTWLVLGVLAVVLAGCGPRSGLTLGRVHGRVTYDGQPVQNGTVTFMPDASQGTEGPSAMGIIDQDGYYVLSTSVSGDGALVGFHKVGITGLELDPVSDASAPPPPDPETDSLGYLKGKASAAQQASQKKSRAGEEETFTDRGGQTFRYVIPKRLGSPEDSGILVKVDRGSNTVNFDVQKNGRVEVSH